MKIVTSVAQDEAQSFTTSLMVLADSLPPPPPPHTPHLLTLEEVVMWEGVERGGGGREKRTKRALALQGTKGTLYNLTCSTE